MPSEDLMVKTDYCGLKTGKKVDKAARDLREIAGGCLFAGQ